MEQQRLARARIAERVTRLRAVLPTRADKWLDVGCGNGMLLITAWERGDHAIGLDMPKRYGRHAPGRGAPGSTFRSH